MLQIQYHAILAHDPGTRLGADPEELHQHRVAVRRLRALLRAARPMIDREWADDLRDELRWLGAALGEVRDLDVLLEHLEDEAAELEPDDAQAFAPVLAVLANRRRGRARTDAGRAAGPALHPRCSSGWSAIWPYPPEAGDGGQAQGDRRRRVPAVSARRGAGWAPTRMTRSCTRRGSRSSARATPPSWRCPPGGKGAAVRQACEAAAGRARRPPGLPPSPPSGCAELAVGDRRRARGTRRRAWWWPARPSAPRGRPRGVPRRPGAPSSEAAKRAWL